MAEIGKLPFGLCNSELWKEEGEEGETRDGGTRSNSANNDDYSLSPPRPQLDSILTVFR